MISTEFTRIYTQRGWLFAEDLMYGDTVVSFNPVRGVCEYDKICNVRLDYKQCGGLGIEKNTMRTLLTPDHPLLIWHNTNKTLKRVQIRDEFMSEMAVGKNKAILAHRPFEPYQRTQDLDDIRWSARIASTFARNRTAFVPDQHIVDDLGGYEAQVWLETFFHWNKKLRAINWQGAIKLNNLQVRDMLFNIGWRAGVGTKWHLRGNRLVGSITIHGNVNPSPLYGWYAKPIDGIVFNVATKNGNLLIKSYNGTYLMACEYGGVDASAV